MSKEKIMLRIQKGILAPADCYAAEALRRRKYQIGDIVAAQISKCRNPKFNRFSHALGKLIVENIEDFAGLDAHRALKRCQIEAGLECDEIGLRIEGMMVIQRIPRSLSFDSMGEDEFRGLMRGICRHIAEKYWPGMDEAEIERMALMMVSD